MGGGLMQLFAMGAKDVYLTGNPQITFFKVVYRRHTNFSKECIKQSLTGTTSQTCTLSRNGDLVQEMYLYKKDGIISFPDSIEVEIGGQKIDKHYKQWLAIYDQVFDDNRTLKGEINSAAGGFMPLRFWFNRNPGLALPLIALQYHEVKVVAEFASPEAGAKCNNLLVNYLYLDTDERRRFAQVSHEYLIEQVQHTGVETIGTGGDVSKSITLTFNHPVKALFWTGLDVDTTGYKAKIQLNGHDRASEQAAMYFTGVQPYECGLRHGNVSSSAELSLAKVGQAGMYSFCLKPAEHQPSGTCNFSRIDNARLVLSNVTHDVATTTQSLYVFALNYNVLRIMSGMGGLAYSN